MSERGMRDDRGSTIVAMVFMGVLFAAIIAGIASEGGLPVVAKVILAVVAGSFGVSVLYLIWLSGTKGESR